MTNFIQKFATATAVVAMVFSLAGTAQAASHAAGSLVKSSDGTVWFINDSNQRQAFTSAGALTSYGFLSFSQVVDANADDLALAQGPFIAPANGTIMCSDRGADQGTCYLMTDGQKAGFTSAAVFTGLGYSFDKSISGDVSFVPSTTNIDNTTDAHRAGTLINNGGTVQLRATSDNCGIPDLATFNSWGYSFDNVVPSNIADRAITQGTIMSGRSAGQLNPTCSTSPVTPPTNGPLSVAASSSMPASTTVVAGQAAADLAHFVLNGSGTVTNVKLKRTGISNDNVFDRVYLYDGNVRLTDSASISNNGEINFNNPAGLFTVNGSRTISARADIAAAATSGQTVGVNFMSGVASGGAISGAPVNGNLHTVAAVSTLAGVSFGTVTPSIAASIDASNDVIVWQSTLTVSNNDVNLGRMTLREIGSINYSDIQNLRLQVDGVQVASIPSLDSNGFVTFTINPQKELTTGSHQFVVLGDVVGGADRNYRFSLREKADIGLYDEDLNVGVSLSSTTPAESAVISINAGSVTYEKATDSPSGDVTIDGTDLSLGKFKLTPRGESVDLERLTVGFTSSDGAIASLRNGRILIDGQQYGSTSTLLAGGTQFNTNFIGNPGVDHIVEVRADMFDNDGTNNVTAGDTFTVNTLAGSANAQGQNSLATFNVPSGTVTANQVTAASGNILLTEDLSYSDRTVVVPQSAYKLGDYNLSGDGIEDVLLSTISIDFGGVGTFTFADLTDVYVKVGSYTSSVKSSVVAAGNAFSIQETLPKDGSLTVEVYGNILSGGVTAADTMTTTVGTITGTTTPSGNTVTAGPVTGQTVTAGAASLTAIFDSSSPDARIVEDNQTIDALSTRFTAQNDAFTINDLTFTSANGAPVTGARLMDGATLVQEKSLSGTSVTFNNVGVNVPANGDKILTLQWVLGGVGQAGSGSINTSSQDVMATLTSFDAAPVSTGQEATTAPAIAGNAQLVFKAIPMIEPVALPSTTLSAGDQIVSKFSVTAAGGSIAWRDIDFAISLSGGTTATTPRLYDAGGSTLISNVTCTGTTAVECVSTTDQQITGSKTYTLRMTIGGTVTTGSFVTSNIPLTNAAFASGTQAALTGAANSFVWTDLSASGHTTTSADYFNEGGATPVLNLPTISQTRQFN